MKRASGCLFGLAIGDALGAPTEFLSVPEILERFPPAGPRDLPVDRSGVARVTDDTQMTLAVGEALRQVQDARQPLAPEALEPALRRTFVAWLRSPDNNRAPGTTCLRACESLARGTPWPQATVPSSKGCGANMRVAPVGLLPAAPGGAAAAGVTGRRVDAGIPHDDRAGGVVGGRRAPDGSGDAASGGGVPDDSRAAIAQFQAALTHGHPTALAASDLTAWAIAALVSGTPPARLPRDLRAYAHSQRRVYHERYLGPLWQQPGVADPQAFIARGWDECLAALDRLDRALAHPDRESDPCLATGDGWVAEEALTTGLLCFLLFTDDPCAAVRRAALTRGDSDSIACLSGAFAGAYAGRDAWPPDWLAAIEYRDRLSALGALWDDPH